MTPWEMRERGLEHIRTERPNLRRGPASPALLAELAEILGDEEGPTVWFSPPRLRGVSHQRRIEIEQTIARTGSVAATMQQTEASYEIVHTLMEWMAA